MMSAWPRLEDSARREPEALAAALHEAAQLDASAGLTAMTPASAIAGAVVGMSGHVIYSDASFETWFGRPTESLDFRRLIKQAIRDGHASGLVEASDGAAMAASAGTREAAAGWPLSKGCRVALSEPGHRLALLAFAPSRASDLAMRAAEAFGLTPLEARLAEALLDAPNLHEAAARIGVGRETARDALRGAMRKSGARRSPDLVRRMMELMCGDHPPAPDLERLLASSFGATPAEARAAARFAAGMTAREAAAALGVKEATVRGQLKSVFAKTGVNKAKDLVRLAAEAGGLAAVTTVSENRVESADAEGRLRILPTAGDRRIAFIDYGPRGGRPLVVFHGSSTGRTLAPRLQHLLHGLGWRPIVPQRPGFGLTDRAAGDFRQCAADDLVAILDALKAPQADLLIRDAATAAGLAFAARHPGRVRRGVLVNPHAPSSAYHGFPTLRGAVMRTFASHPELIEAFAEMMRRQTRTDLLRKILRQSLVEIPSDLAAVGDPAVMEQMIRDAQALSARSSAGFAAEHAGYARGWTIPEHVGGEAWSVLQCDALAAADAADRWRHLPGFSYSTHATAGLLIYYSDPEAVAAAVGKA